MKKLIILSLLLVVTTAAFSQNDKQYIEQYCQVIATPRAFSSRVTIEIDFGEERSVWRDNRLKTYDGKLKKFNTVVDALNYMGKDGWTFINAYPVRSGNSEVYHFAFKKMFLKTEVEE